MYSLGDGVEKNINEAEKWSSLAAEQGLTNIEPQEIDFKSPIFKKNDL
jgi:TPR repeat protein